MCCYRRAEAYYSHKCSNWETLAFSDCLRLQFTKSVEKKLILIQKLNSEKHLLKWGTYLQPLKNLKCTSSPVEFFLPNDDCHLPVKRIPNSCAKCVTHIYKLVVDQNQERRKKPLLSNCSLLSFHCILIVTFSVAVSTGSH